MQKPYECPKFSKEDLLKFEKAAKPCEPAHEAFASYLSKSNGLSELDQKVYNDIVAFLKDLKAKNRTFLNLLPTVLVFLNDRPRPSLLESYNPDDPVISFEITLHKKRDKQGRIYAYKAQYLDKTLLLPEYI